MFGSFSFLIIVSALPEKSLDIPAVEDVQYVIINTLNCFDLL